MTFYIVLRTVTFANAEKSGGYQIAKLREGGFYSLLSDGDTEFSEVEGLGNNWPRHFEECQKWVIALNERS